MPHSINDIELAYLQAGSQVPLLQDYQRTTNKPSTRFASIELLAPWFSHVDPNFARRNKRFFGRDVALFLIQLLSVLVLGFHLSITVYALVEFGARDNVRDVLGVESGGDCAIVKVWNRWLLYLCSGVLWKTLVMGREVASRSPPLPT